jgi:hypothetical protein
MSYEIASVIYPPKIALVLLNFIVQCVIMQSMDDFNIGGSTDTAARQAAIVFGLIFSVVNIISLLVGGTMFHNIANYFLCY